MTAQGGLVKKLPFKNETDGNQNQTDSYISFHHPQKLISECLHVTYVNIFIFTAHICIQNNTVDNVRSKWHCNHPRLANLYVISRLNNPYINKAEE
jgi:hypothetical protein